MKPATPLPWITRTLGDADHCIFSQTTTLCRVRKDADASYIAHAANAYPKLIELATSLRSELVGRPNMGLAVANIDRLLRELDLSTDGCAARRCVRRHDRVHQHRSSPSALCPLREAH